MVQSATRIALPVTAGLFVACAVVQVFLAGLGVFDDPGAFITHREFGYLIGWFTLAMLILALVGREPRRIVGLTVLVLAQFALQSVLVALRADMPAVAALHPLNGFAILAVGLLITKLSWAVRRESRPAVKPAPVPGSTSPAPAAEAG
jgi:Family of unknown function (DUF6220)